MQIQLVPLASGGALIGDLRRLSALLHIYSCGYWLSAKYVNLPVTLLTITPRLSKIFKSNEILYSIGKRIHIT